MARPQIQIEKIFKLRTLTVKPVPVIYDDFKQLLTPRKNQRCWLCRKTELIPKENCYEVAIGIDTGKRNNSGAVFRRKKVLCCDVCLCSIPELRDVEIISFGNGVELSHNYVADSMQTSEPVFHLNYFGLD